MLALVPNTVTMTGFGDKKNAPKSIGFQYRFTGLDTDPDEAREFIVDGSQWQNQLGFHGACTLWYRNNQASSVITQPVVGFASLTSPDFDLSFQYNTQGFVPIQIDSDVIKFIVSTGIVAGAGAIDIVVPFRLFNASIESIVESAGLV